MQTQKKLYWHFAASCCLVLFMILGYLVKFYEGTLLVVDLPLLNFVRQAVQPGLTPVVIALTQFGSGKVIALLTVAVAALLLWRRYWLDTLWLAINVALIAGVGNYLIKFLFLRARPGIEHLVTETHYSFPSGHAMGSLLFYGTLIVLLPRFIPQQQICRVCQGLLGLFILMIGLSRLYLGVHYPSDILGGFLLGGAWLLGTYPTFAQLRFRWRFTGKQK